MPDNSMPVAIETRALTKHFGTQCAVDSIDLHVQCGTFYGFLGPNGAGKSTTIKMLTGLLAPSSGGIAILGMNPFDAEQSIELKRRIGVVPEDLSLFDYLTATEYLMFIGRMFQMDKSLIRQRSAQLLEMMKLEEEQKKLTFEYSHGMKKKLALAAAMLPNPDLLFLDEPFEGVDAVTSRLIRDMLHDFTSRGSTVFLTSHVLELVERLCTHVGIISDGKLVQQSSLDDLRGSNSLEESFLETVGTDAASQTGLSWLGGDSDLSNVNESVDTASDQRPQQ